MDSKTKFKVLGIVLWAALLLGCQSGSEPSTSETAEGEGASGGASGKVEEQVQKVTVPAGAQLSVRLGDAIDTGKTTKGSSFEGTLAAPLVVSGVEVAATGSRVTGEVTHVVSSGRLTKPAELGLVLTSLTPQGGSKVEITTQTWSMKGESHKKRNIAMIGGGGGAGALVGALTGGKKGAAIGAAVGAGAGTGAAAVTGKKEIQLAPEAKLNFKLSAPVTIESKR